MKLVRFTYCFLLVFSICITANAQKSIKNDADKYFEKGKFFEALKLYNIYDKIDKSKDALLNRAICNFECHKLMESKADFNQLAALGMKDKELDFYRGEVMFADHKFKEAAIFYKRALSHMEDKKARKEIIHKIKQCAFGLDHAFDEQIAFVENLGDVVNSRYDELNAIQSPNFDDKFYFSSNREGSTGGMRDEKGLKDDVYGNYSLDIMVCQSYNGIWEQPSSLDPLLNSSKNDYIQDFNSDGSVMLYKKSLMDLTKGSIMVDTFKSERDPGAYASAFISPMVGELGDGYIEIFNDSTFIFSSKRAGGYGGYDLYVTGHRDGEWTTPFNLGPNVNSDKDEITPFVSNDGRTLFFSSNRKEAFGGFDIYTTLLSGENPNWDEVKNLGMPINSTGDDINFRLSNNGMTGTFSSDRKIGQGGFDLYIAYLTKQNMSQLAYSPRFMFYEDRLEKYLEKLEEDPDVTVDEVIVLEEEKNDDEVIKKREVVISPFFYGDDDNVLTTQNQIKLKNLTDLMVIYPDLKIRLVSNSIKEGLANYDIYFSIKRVEKLRDAIVSTGISEDRIQLIACGPNYPLVKSEIAGSKITLASKLNRRIDLILLNSEELNIDVIEEKPVVADYLKDPKSELFYTQMSGLSYRIEVARVNQMFQSSIVSNTNDVLIEEEDKAYVYTVGIHSNFKSAKKTKNLLGKKRLLDTKIAAYVDGVRLDNDTLGMYTEEYPDLVEFLEFLNQ